MSSPPKRSENFYHAQEEALRLLQEQLEIERRSKTGLIPQPDCYLFGRDSIDSQLYEQVAQLLVLLTAERNDVREISISQLCMRIAVHIIDRRALESLEATGQTTLMHPLSYIRTAIESEEAPTTHSRPSQLEVLASHSGKE